MLYFDAPTDSAARLHPRDLVGACFEHDTRQLLLNHGALPADFFDLSSGVAGDLAQKLTNYGIRTAAVLPDPEEHSESFQAFAREAARSGQFRFFRSRDQAVEWLTSGT
jgi:hypothetical protein